MKIGRISASGELQQKICNTMTHNYRDHISVFHPLHFIPQLINDIFTGFEEIMLSFRLMKFYLIRA